MGQVKSFKDTILVSQQKRSFRRMMCWHTSIGCNTHSHFTRTYRSSQVNKPRPPDDILRAFWELESLGIVDKPEQRMTAEERAPVAQVSKTLEVRNGRYRIGILWKEGEPKLTNNYEVALMRLKSQEKSLRRKGPKVMDAYNEIFQNYKKKKTTFVKCPNLKL